MPKNKTALVISGGGPKGAFAVGAIGVLRANGIRFDVVTGTSTGALIAPLVATDEVPLLRHIYSTVRTPDVVKPRSSVLDIALSDGLFDTSPLWSLIQTYISEARYRAVLASAIEIFLCTVNLQSGQVEYFNPKQPFHDQQSDRLTFLRAILASASQPVLMPPVRIISGGDQYVDGGVREVAPLGKAVDEGADEVYAIVLSPERAERREQSFTSLDALLVRTIDLFGEEVMENDLKAADFVNSALVATSSRTKRKAGAARRSARPAALTDKRKLTLHVIRPEHSLPGDGLEFSPLVMSEMMAMGEAAAKKLLGL
jgi:predicted acylesterase/phospholipase RssA